MSSKLEPIWFVILKLGYESAKKLEEDNQQTTAEPLKENIEKPAFAITIPMREDQIQNAVKFLSHPKVRGSPVIYRRSFLEKKGLTKEEIDEAFRRVPVSNYFHIFHLKRLHRYIVFPFNWKYVLTMNIAFLFWNFIW